MRSLKHSFFQGTIIPVTNKYNLMIFLCFFWKYHINLGLIYNFKCLSLFFFNCKRRCIFRLLFSKITLKYFLKYNLNTSYDVSYDVINYNVRSYYYFNKANL